VLDIAGAMPAREWREVRYGDLGRFGLVLCVADQPAWLVFLLAGHIIKIMTQVLEKAIVEVSKLPPDEQDRIGQWLLTELADDRAWDEKFAASQDALEKLADNALAEIRGGQVEELDLAKL
jgi:hypothetical protein